MLNFASQITTFLATLVAGSDVMNPKDAAVRRLGIASQLESEGRKSKEKAKRELKGLGLLPEQFVRGRTETLYDSKSFTLIAETNEEAAMVLKEECLRAALGREKLSAAAVARVIEGAYGTNKPATKLKVIQK